MFVKTAGDFGIPMEGLDEVQAATALINQLVPQQRPPGSGQMSDRDVELFKQSVPRIINQPGGNKRIIDTMRAMAEYDQQRGIIAQNVLLGRITPEQAFEEYNALANPLQWVRTFGQASMPASARSAGITQQEWDVMTDEEKRAFME